MAHTRGLAWGRFLFGRRRSLVQLIQGFPGGRSAADDLQQVLTAHAEGGVVWTGVDAAHLGAWIVPHLGQAAAKIARRRLVDHGLAVLAWRFVVRHLTDLPVHVNVAIGAVLGALPA